MAYTKLGWVNDRAPALNQTNLNHMDQGIYDAHQELAEYEGIFTGDVAESVQNWLDAHPEATTTVQDHSLGYEKLIIGTLGFVTPEMFGAVGDGNTDDTSAIQQALDNRGVVLFDAKKTYRVTAPLRVSDHTYIELNGSTINSEYKHLFLNFLDTDAFAAYSGNGDIVIRDGTIYGGGISFWHCENILVNNIHFNNCLNDHWFEICACKDFTIQNCSFVGMKYREGAVHEYINIDPCTTEPSTYFTGGSYPAGNYDGTRNLNIYIRNNYFDINTEAGLDYDFSAMDNAFGCHSPIGNYHKNIQFVGNTVLNFKQLALRLSDMDSCLVKNNYIKSAINTDWGVVMSKSGAMTYANIDCRFENNYFAPNKWGLLIRDALRFSAVGNVYDNQDNANHAFGTIGANNKQLYLQDNRKQGNSSVSLWSLDSGDYTAADATNPFDVLDVSSTAVSVSGQKVTNTKHKWTSFDRLIFRFAGINRMYVVDANYGETFRENINYPICINEADQSMPISFIITSGTPNELTINYASGVSQRTFYSLHAEKKFGSNIAR